MTAKTKDGCWRPYLSTDRNHFRADITRQLEEYLRQVLKKNTSSCLGGDEITRKRFTDGRMDRRMDGWTNGRRRVHHRR